MSKQDLRLLRTAAATVVVVAAAAVCRSVAQSTDLPCLDKLANFVRFFLYFGLFAVWGASVQRRVIQSGVRRILVTVALLMIFWLTLRELRWHLVPDVNLRRFLWYCYYIPLLLISPLAFLAAISMSRPEGYRLPRRTALLFIPMDNDEAMKPTDTFKAGKYYGAIIALIVDQDYAPDPSLFKNSTEITVSGANAVDADEISENVLMLWAIYQPLEETEVTLKSISIANLPAKLEYYAGETFDKSGMMVTATYSDQSQAEVQTYTVSPTVLTASDKTVTVSYTEGGITKTATVAVTVKDSGKTNPFKDIFDTDYYYDAVIWAYYAEPQVTNGMSTTEFSPWSTVTRGLAVTFLWRAMGCPEPSTTANPFVDVKESDYFYKAVLWAVEKGITKGTDDTHFTPTQNCSTAHIITFLYRTLGIGADGWGSMSEAWAKGAGLLAGLDITVAPGVDCPRCDVVFFLWRALAK